MSPEQIEGRPVDARSDLFALGVVLCEAVTGTNPFARPGLVETISAIGRTPEPVVATMPNVPKPVGSIVIKAVQKDPAERYPTAADFAAALDPLIRQLGAPAPPRGLSRRTIAAAAAALVVAAGVGGFAYERSAHRHWVRETAVPEVNRLAGEEHAAAALPVIEAAERYLPGDPDLGKAIARATRVVSIDSKPPGAEVDVKDYLAPDEDWLPLGVTPLDRVRVPAGYLRWKVSAAGVESITAPETDAAMHFDLEAPAKSPDGMVPVPGGVWTDSFAFFGWLGPYDLPEFFIDRFEVSNRQYQRFVDQGGYTTPKYWTQPFVRDGRTLSWDEAMNLFRDSTGRAGPSTWDAGHFPEGKDDFPVTGVSWFEAAAYAEFAGKSLPVIAQSAKASPYQLDHYVAQLSNVSNTVARVGAFAGLGRYGTYDLVGNVREWAWNATDNGERFMLGRQPASYGPEALSPFDRSPLNGFRCVRNTGPLPGDAAAPRAMLRRDFSKATPAADAVFRVYRNMYAYDKAPLHATVEEVADPSEDWTRQRITFDTAYGGRMWAFLFLPKHVRPPYQTVVFAPSARVLFLQNSAALGDLTFMDYVVKSGRAVMYPIYQGMYERQLDRPVPGPRFQREVVIDWSKDLGRSIDYLETRQDIDRSRIGYLGVSAGSAYGVILTALEDRLKAVVFLDGGYFQQEHPITGMDQADFAPRLTKPVLMINGRYDATFPADTAQAPFFRMLGTPEADKRRVVLDTPHDVRLDRSTMVKEVLAWYDKYLGRVQQ
jgi:eukaryotic-like serine/threonine-protein kinase